jgi:hypothetical protein
LGVGPGQKAGPEQEGGIKGKKRAAPRRMVGKRGRGNCTLPLLMCATTPASLYIRNADPKKAEA